jgi:hypothetical protein
MKKWWILFLRLPWDKRILWASAALSLPPIGLSLLAPSSPQPAAATGPSAQVDTHIPRGFVLVPIEVRNYEALDSILGPFGIVDLYQGEARDGSDQRLIARDVRILRAPKNPSHFAVLIRESEAASVLRFSGLFTVIVKRPGAPGTEFVKEPPRTHHPIVYEGG